MMHYYMIKLMNWLTTSSSMMESTNTPHNLNNTPHISTLPSTTPHSLAGPNQNLSLESSKNNLKKKKKILNIFNTNLYKKYMKNINLYSLKCQFFYDEKKYI